MSARCTRAVTAVFNVAAAKLGSACQVRMVLQHPPQHGAPIDHRPSEHALETL